jgi:hypothetical protein
VIRTSAVLAFLVAHALGVLPGCAPPAEAALADRAVVVVIDGLRYSEGLGDPEARFVPHMAALCSIGTKVEPFLNDGITYTSEAIPASWMGGWFGSRDTVLEGRQTQYAAAPTFFEAYRKQLSRPAEDCVYFIKDVYSLWRQSFDPEYGPDYWPHTHMAGYTDTEVWNEFQAEVPILHPRLIYLYLAGVDGAGHSGDWAEYTYAVTVADDIVGQLWTFLEADTFYAGRTAVFVTNDHGRHDDAHGGFSGHGDGCDGCRTIQLLAIGPDFAPGRICPGPRSLVDVAPTVASLLGFEMPWATGQAMEELWAPVDTVEPPVEADGPIRLSLAPNPWRPGRAALRVSWVLPREGPVRLELLDLAGRVRRGLRIAQARAGRGASEWDAVDDHGAALEPGVYFVRITRGPETAVRRVVLVD